MPMAIDASCQAGNVVLDGSSAGGVDGLKAQAKVTITSLVIDNFSGNGINLDVGSGQSVVQNDLIGVGASGTTPAGNGSGVLVATNSDTIGGTGANQGNVISGNNGAGVVVNGNGTAVAGN